MLVGRERHHGTQPPGPNTGPGQGTGSGTHWNCLSGSLVCHLCCCIALCLAEPPAAVSAGGSNVTPCRKGAVQGAQGVSKLLLIIMMEQAENPMHRGGLEAQQFAQAPKQHVCVALPSRPFTREQYLTAESSLHSLARTGKKQHLHSQLNKAIITIFHFPLTRRAAKAITISR